MGQVKDHTVDTYWIAKAIDNSVIHHGCIPVGGVVDSGQEEMETFTEEQACIDRLIALGIKSEDINF